METLKTALDEQTQIVSDLADLEQLLVCEADTGRRGALESKRAACLKSLSAASWAVSRAALIAEIVDAA